MPSTLWIYVYFYPDGFIDPNYTCVGVGYCKFDDKTNIVTITKPENVEGYLQLGLHRIYVPELVEDEPVPSTSTGTVEEPKKEEPKKEEPKKEEKKEEVKKEEPKEETKKENPDTSTSSMLVAGLSILGIAVLGVAARAIIKAKRA